MGKSSLTRKIKEELNEKYGNQCAICGVSSSHLEISHTHPLLDNGLSDTSGLILICPNCNYQIDKEPFRELDLVNYLFKLLSQSTQYKTVKQDATIDSESKYRVDLLAIDTKGHKLLIEVKSLPAYSKSRVDLLIEQLLVYQLLDKSATLILAFPGLLPNEAYEKFRESNIEVWDQHYISKVFEREIAKTPHPIFHKLFGSPIAIKDEEELIFELGKTKTGKEDWFKYEKLIEKILDNLFGKTLSSPITNHSDNTETNRRDIILANYCESGFWCYMRQTYAADYIVVDAKNYSKRTQKKEVLQIANYLKRHGTGLFGIIISRNGEDKGSNVTRRELWLIHNKLIIVLDDNDIIAMLRSKSPEAIIKQKIEDFRLSI